MQDRLVWEAAVGWSMWTGYAAWPYLLVIGVCLVGILWITSPAQRSRRRRRDARARIAVRRALRGEERP
ncbi:MAG TPA: hypothetical protein VGD84_00170 [Pseudonocardiaceae bacterium]